MLTTSGESDKLQFSINTIKLVTDIEQESQDMFLGMVLKINQLCHILWTLEPMSSTVPSRETATLLHNLNEQGKKFFKNMVQLIGVKKIRANIS